GARRGLPVLFSRSIDLSAASVLSSAGLGLRFTPRRSWGRRRSRRAAAKSTAAERPKKPCGAVANARELLLQRRAIDQPVGFGLHGADQSAQLLGQRDDPLLDRVGFGSA